MKKITILTTGDFPYGGAPEAIVRNIAFGISANNVDVEVIRHRGEVYKRENDTHIRCSDFLYKKYSKNEIIKSLQVISSILFTPIFIASIKRKEVLILYGFEYSYHILPMIFFCKLKNIRIYRFITDHYRESSIAPVWWKTPKLIFYKRQIERFDKYLDGVIVLSKFLVKQCKKNNIIEENILLTPHYIKLDDDMKRRKKEEKACITIGFCGTIVVMNGVIDLIVAFNILKEKYSNLKLQIIGKENSEIMKNLKNNKIDLKQIEFTGFLSTLEVESKLNNCNILVNPRRLGIASEAGFPTKLGEYFSTGNPVVTTKIGDIAEYFCDGREVKFAEPNNPRSLYMSISYLIDNTDESKEIGERGYKWAKGNLDYIKNSQKLIQFINRKS